MTIKPSGTSGFTWIEALVALAISGILIAVIISKVTNMLALDQMSSTISNMKQLHLATYAMVMDGQTNKDTNLGWPGDTGGTFSNWTKQLLSDYLGTNDLRKLLSAPGKIVPPGEISTMQDSAVLAYAVSTNSQNLTVFLTTANFTNTPTGGLPLLPTAKPYGNKGFVVFSKAGEGAVLQPKQVGMTNLIGTYVPLLR